MKIAKIKEHIIYAMQTMEVDGTICHLFSWVFFIRYLIENDTIDLFIFLILIFYSTLKYTLNWNHEDLIDKIELLNKKIK